MDPAVAHPAPVLTALILLAAPACASDPGAPGDDPYPEVDRHAIIPRDAVKGTPSNDEHPPVLHSADFAEPVPLPVISTAGAEDSPFIPAGGDELYFFFAADVRQDPSIQIRDPVNGVWVSRRGGGGWQEPTLVWLQSPGTLALNGCPFVAGDEMVFCSAREGHSGVSWFRAVRTAGSWTDWESLTFPAAHQVGELHIHGDALYYGSARPGGAGGEDIWVSQRSGGTWAEPLNVAAVNTAADETRPFVTADGSELWITRTYQGTPAVLRSRKVAGAWQAPELVVSRFAGEPTLDAQGNLYFVHHFYAGGTMREADIYVAYRKP